MTAAMSGTLEVTVDMASMDGGHERFEAPARSKVVLDVDKFPTATCKGRLANFKGTMATEVDGELTLHGVTKPVDLTITQFLCKVHPQTKKHVCGADATTVINRKDFGANFAEDLGFRMDTKLLISVEAIEAE